MRLTARRQQTAFVTVTQNSPKSVHQLVLRSLIQKLLLVGCSSLEDHLMQPGKRRRDEPGPLATTGATNTIQSSNKRLDATRESRKAKSDNPDRLVVNQGESAAVNSSSSSAFLAMDDSASDGCDNAQKQLLLNNSGVSSSGTDDVLPMQAALPGISVISSAQGVGALRDAAVHAAGMYVIVLVSLGVGWYS